MISTVEFHGIFNECMRMVFGQSLEIEQAD